MKYQIPATTTRTPTITLIRVWDTPVFAASSLAWAVGVEDVDCCGSAVGLSEARVDEEAGVADVALGSDGAAEELVGAAGVDSSEGEGDGVSDDVPFTIPWEKS